MKNKIPLLFRFYRKSDVQPEHFNLKLNIVTVVLVQQRINPE